MFIEVLPAVLFGSSQHVPRLSGFVCNPDRKKCARATSAPRTKNDTRRKKTGTIDVHTAPTTVQKDCDGGFWRFPRLLRTMLCEFSWPSFPYCFLTNLPNSCCQGFASSRAQSIRLLKRSSNSGVCLISVVYFFVFCASRRCVLRDTATSPGRLVKH